MVFRGDGSLASNRGWGDCVLRQMSASHKVKVGETFPRRGDSRGSTVSCRLGRGWARAVTAFPVHGSAGVPAVGQVKALSRHEGSGDRIAAPGSCDDASSSEKATKAGRTHRTPPETRLGSARVRLCLRDPGAERAAKQTGGARTWVEGSRPPCPVCTAFAPGPAL